MANAYLPEGINRNFLTRNVLLTVNVIFNLTRSMAGNVW